MWRLLNFPSVHKISSPGNLPGDFFYPGQQAGGLAGKLRLIYIRKKCDIRNYNIVDNPINFFTFALRFKIFG
jgi:hypothetical protein